MRLTHRDIVRRDDRRYDEVAADHGRAAVSAFVREAGSQAEAAKRLGVNQTTISRSLDPAGQPSLRVLIELARVTGRSLDRILGLDLRTRAANDAPAVELTPSPPPAVVK